MGRDQRKCKRTARLGHEIESRVGGRRTRDENSCAVLVL
jgi:hypothetical protein